MQDLNNQFAKSHSKFQISHIKKSEKPNSLDKKQVKIHLLEQIQEENNILKNTVNVLKNDVDNFF